MYFFRKADPAHSVLVKLVLNLLQLCKLAANHPGGRDILGERFLLHSRLFCSCFHTSKGMYG